LATRLPLRLRRLACPALQNNGLISRDELHAALNSVPGGSSVTAEQVRQMPFGASSRSHCRIAAPRPRRIGRTLGLAPPPTARLDARWSTFAPIITLALALALALVLILALAAAPGPPLLRLRLQVDSIFEALDQDGKGTINYLEFLAATLQVPTAYCLPPACPNRPFSSCPPSGPSPPDPRPGGSVPARRTA
jgi:hypothetical protein